MSEPAPSYGSAPGYVVRRGQVCLVVPIDDAAILEALASAEAGRRHEHYGALEALRQALEVARMWDAV